MPVSHTANVQRVRMRDSQIGWRSRYAQAAVRSDNSRYLSITELAGSLPIAGRHP
jgi:hypothetical protein